VSAENESVCVAAESGRDRVRRLLIAPLQGAGMRFKKGAKNEKGQLDQIADDLTYMSDQGLADVRLSLRTKGQGADRCFWPARVTILSLAETRQARPLKELPSLLRWFASDAGKRAFDEGRLVAEYGFWTRNKRPPVHLHEFKSIKERAEIQEAKFERLKDRDGRGVLVDPADCAWLDGYRKRRAYVAGLVIDRQGVQGND
jgi:hypothetical protein